jgi:cobalt-zinc-cadmium efflux system membrane fusion protein
MSSLFFGFCLLVLSLLGLTACGGQRSVAGASSKSAGTGSDSNRFEAKQIRVEPVRVVRAPVEQVLAPGKIEVNPGALSKVALPLAGRVTRVLVQVGDYVQQGTPLVILDSPDTGTTVSNYQQALAKIVQAKSEVAKAEADLSRVQDLLSHGAVAEKDVLSARAALTQAQSDLAQANAAEEEGARKLKIFGIDGNGKNDQILVPAPVSGKVLELGVVAGEYRNDTSAPVMTIADLSTIFMTADVPETSIRLIQPGQQVRMKLDAYPTETFTGRVHRIGDTVDPATRTIRVRVALNNPKEQFRPDMFGQLEISGPVREMMSVPRGAVVQTSETPVIYRERGPGHYERVPVTLGDRLGDYVLVLSGLTKSDRVVIDGPILARSMSQ